MEIYDMLIALLLANKDFDEIDKDDFLFALYQIWDMGFWDDEYDIPLNYKRRVARINNFLNIDINKINESWASRSVTLQHQFVDYFSNILKKKYLKKNTLYVISNRIAEDDSHGAKSIIYEIPSVFTDDGDKQFFIDCVNELIKLNHCRVVRRNDNDLTSDDIENLFKNISPHFLHIICQDRISDGGDGTVFVIRLTDAEVRVLTGISTKYNEGWYLKAHFSPLTNAPHDKNGVGKNNGIGSVDTIELVIRYASAKNSYRKINVNHFISINAGTSGLPFDVKVKFAAVGQGEKKQPCILIKCNGRSIPYLIDRKEPHFLSTHKVNISTNDGKLLKKWTMRNYDILSKYLNGEVTDKSVLDAIVPVKSIGVASDQ